MHDDQLKNEAVYEQARAERYLWERQKATGLSRRQLLRLMATGAGAAALGFVPGAARRVHASHPGSIVKPTDKLRVLGTNAEMRWELMYNQGYVVPKELFFVRNHIATPHIDVDTWRLRIEGSGPVELTHDDILSMGSESETTFIECAGNGRSFFGTQQGTPASGTQWRLGAIGVAEWTGVRLSTVLEYAGLKNTAVDVMPEGLDNPIGTSGHVRRPIPIEKALEDDTLLVYAMNGEPLPEDHGFPVRVLVPRWVGIANVKWVGRIEVSEQPLFSPWNLTSYRFFGPDYPADPEYPYPPPGSAPLTEQEVKSAFELAWDAQLLPETTYLLRGRSWSAHKKLERVDVSFDGEVTWQAATLKKPNHPKAWVRWEIVWTTPQVPGSYTLRARATDKADNVQPTSVPFNSQGYLFWAIVKHPVTVTP